MVSDITNSYIETIKDAAKIGDVIRAEIVSNKAGLFNAQIKGYDYGVVLGFCSKCRHPLQIYKTDSKNRELKEMVCINCRNIEKRKTSKYYTK
jgi:exosome complex component CSL4